MTAPQSLPLPPAQEVRDRLSVAVREVEILRSLLQVSEKAERDLPDRVVNLRQEARR